MMEIDLLDIIMTLKRMGDKRFVTSKLVRNGDVYISVRYENPESGKGTYFDDLNGVDYIYAIQNIKALTDKIDNFKANIAELDIVVTLDDEKIKEISDKINQLMDISDLNEYQAEIQVFKKMGIDPATIKKRRSKKIKNLYT